MDPGRDKRQGRIQGMGDWRVCSPQIFVWPLRTKIYRNKFLMHFVKFFGPSPRRITHPLTKYLIRSWPGGIIWFYFHVLGTLSVKYWLYHFESLVQPLSNNFQSLVPVPEFCTIFTLNCFYKKTTLTRFSLFAKFGIIQPTESGSRIYLSSNTNTAMLHHAMKNWTIILKQELGHRNMLPVYSSQISFNISLLTYMVQLVPQSLRPPNNLWPNSPPCKVSYWKAFPCTFWEGHCLLEIMYLRWRVPSVAELCQVFWIQRRVF